MRGGPRARRQAERLRRTRSSPDQLRDQLARAVGSQEVISTLGLLQRGVNPNVRVPAAATGTGLRSLPASRSTSRVAPPRSLPGSRHPSHAGGLTRPTRFNKPLRRGLSAYGGDHVKFDLGPKKDDGTGQLQPESNEAYRGSDNAAFSSDSEGGSGTDDVSEGTPAAAASETLLHRAARSGSAPVVQMLLEHGADPAARDSAQRTPLHAAALAEAPSDVIRLLVRARGVQLDLQDEDGDTALHLALRLQNRKHAVLLLEAGARADIRNERGRTALRHLVSEFPRALELAFDSSLRLQRPLGWGARTVEFDYSLFEPRLLDDEEEPSMRFLETRLMNTVDNAGLRDKLFLHPLCRSFLSLKWKVISPMYIIDIVMFALFVISFNVFVFSLVDSRQNNGTLVDTLSRQNVSALAGQTLQINFDISVFSVPLSTITFWIVAVLCTYINIRELIKMWVLGLVPYVLGLENLCLWFCTCSAVACLCSDLLSFHSVRQIASVCLLVSWTELLFMLGRAEFASIHVMLFVTLIRTLTLFMMVYTAVTFAFTSSFYVLFYEHSAFNNMLQSFFTTVVMSIGELDYTPHTLDGSGVGYAVYLLFIFFMLIITMNAMVGMAVNDTRDMANRAQIKLLKKYLEFAYLFERHMQWRSRSTLWKIFPNVGVSLLGLLPDRRLAADWRHLGERPATWRQSWRLRFHASRESAGDESEKDFSTCGAVLRSWLAEWPDILRQATSIVIMKRQGVSEEGAEPSQPASGAGNKLDSGTNDDEEGGDQGDGAAASEEDPMQELRHAVLDLKCQIGQVQSELFKINKALRSLTWSSQPHNY